MSKNIRTIALSMVVLCLCTTFIVGGTFALFSDFETVHNRLVAGNLDIELTRVDYREKVLDEEGFLAESTPITTPLDLVNGFEGYLFESVNAVPESWYQATIAVKNKGTTAYDYNVRIVWNEDNSAKDEQKILASQISITITSDKIDNESHSTTFLLSECKDNIVSLGYMVKGDNVDTFTVTAAFIDHEDNNDAMNVALDFDIQVSATQRVKK